jgi:CspA family cold shock protein
MSKRELGTVKWFHNGKGYGFITREDGEDIFVHFSEIQSDGFRKLLEGQQVEFTLSQGDKGLHATEVIALQ